MNCVRIYNSLMENSKQDRKLVGYTEKHHILPVCMGGSNEDVNLVRLTAKEHFIAHWLLYKIHKTPAMVRAWNIVLVEGKGQVRYKTVSHKYARMHLSLIMKEWIKDNHPKGMLGKVHSEETKILISKNNKSKEISGKQVYQYTLCGKFLCGWDCVTDVKRDMFPNIPASVGNICSAANNASKNNQYKDYQWRWFYKDNITAYQKPTFKWFTNESTGSMIKININHQEVPDGYTAGRAYLHKVLP